MDEPVLLRFTDRSRHMTRVGRCPRAAYLSTAFGPTGYGIQRKRQSVPLASGTMLHEALEPIMRFCQQEDVLPDDSIVRDAIKRAHGKYDRIFAARGLQYWESGDAAMQRMVAEQHALIEGFIWCYVLESLPMLLQEYRVISVEQEEVTVYACSCGLGDTIPPWTAHVQRGCQGIGVQTKADWIGERRFMAGQFTYHEFKTTGSYRESFAGRWETDIQPYLGAKGWEERTGNRIAGTYIHGFLKGQRKKERLPGDIGRKYTGPEFQDSLLVYGYCKPAAPPVDPLPDWKTTYDWWDPVEQRARRLGPSYKSTLVLDYPGGVEAWVRQLTSAQRLEQLCVVGPLLPKPDVVEGTLNGWVATELRVSDDLWDLYHAMGTDTWVTPAVQHLLDARFPQSWQCSRYGAKHRCEFLPICERRAGWQDPLAFLDFIPRRPHHEPELIQMRARGLEPPDDLGEDDDE